MYVYLKLKKVFVVKPIMQALSVKNQLNGSNENIFRISMKEEKKNRLKMFNANKMGHYRRKITPTSEDNHAISNANDLNVRRIP